MNENTKTIAFLAAAAIVVLGVWITKPVLIDEGVAVQGTLLFPDFKDPLAAASLDIVKYDEATGDVIPFQVAQVGGVWSIPSHDGYPADAKKQLAEAAASLMDLKVLSVAGDSAGDQGLYGVIDPTDKDIKAGTTGVGMQVTMKDKDGKTLIALVVGMADKDQPGLRYVRRVGQEAVYSVALDTDKLSTKFGDWIEKDLLKLDAFDISRIFIQDYSIDEAQGTLLQRGEMSLGYEDTGEARWKMLSDREFSKEGKWVPVAMTADEELNTQNLDALKSALDDLKIADVARKPAGLSADLAADKSFLDNRDAIMSLMQRGFYLAKAGDKTAIYSNEGEVRCLMKDGVEYVLRFGNIAESGKGAATKADKDKEKAKKPEDAAEGADDSGVNRYIFVMTEFNPEGIPKPDLQPLPSAEEKKPEAEAAKKADEPKPTDAKPAEDAKKPEEKKPEGDAAKKADEPKPADAKPAEEAKKPEGDAAKKPEEKKPEGDAAKKVDEAKPADPAKPPEEPKKTEAELKAERERIEKENKRKQDEYDAKLAAGTKKVGELNQRFAGWYYVISDNVYKKIHLGRKEVIKPKEKKEGEKPAAGATPPPPGATPDAFRQLKDQGLEKKE
jgi:hypothetical protein